MAIVQNFWLKGSKKRLAGAVIYEAMGQTRARQLASSVTNPRTEAQMSQRIRWANLVSFYRANSSWMKYAFETKKSNQSEYNKFMSVNVTASPIALTKDAAAAGACVVAPYIITQGSLPSVEWQDAGEQIKSNLFLPAGDTISAETTVGELSQGLIEMNPAIREGDQLSLIRFTQMTNGATGYPYIIVRKYEVIMKSDSTALLSDYMPIDYLQAPGLTSQNAIFVNKGNRQGGFAVILSRTIAGKTYVSTQQVITVNNDTLINQYSSASAIAAAIDSYGQSTDAFLSTVSAATAQTAPVPLSLNAMQIDGVTYVGGSKTPTGLELQNKSATAVFSSGVATTERISVRTGYLGTTEVATDSAPTVSGNRITFNPREGTSTSTYEQHVAYIAIEIGGVEYRLTFASSNDYTQEGLD